MKLAKFWTRQAGEARDSNGEVIRVLARGWSNESLQAAAEVARQIASTAAQRLATDFSDRKQYGYGDRPLPEPVVREFRDTTETPNAVITRNVYGALVMNARDLMFVDIDRENVQPVAAIAQNLMSSVFSLFSKPAAQPAPPPPQAGDGVVEGIQKVAARNGLVVRVYKTAAGYRAMVVNAGFDASSARSEELLKEFGADPLYVRLCKMQQSFRARLTPKPWRCEIGTPPVSFPFETADAEARFQQWVRQYTAKSAGYATCKFLASSGTPHEAFSELVAYHDSETKAGSGLPLA
jgi:hypothetical protein